MSTENAFTYAREKNNLVERILYIVIVYTHIHINTKDQLSQKRIVSNFKVTKLKKNCCHEYNLKTKNILLIRYNTINTFGS